MLIQPFIENAINHGLFHKKEGQGFVNLTINKIDNILNFEIVDNGIGIEAASKIKKNRKHKDASHALEIVRERTALYNKTMKEDIDLNIKNRYDEQGHIIGTIVSMSLVLPDGMD